MSGGDRVSTADRWFVTGISTGFGRDLARELVRTGHKVVGTVRQEAQRAELEAEGIATILMDVNNDAEVEAAVPEVRARLGGVDVVVNNAGFGLSGAIEALSLDEIRGVMNTNFYGVVRVTRAFLPLLREHGGGIFVNISSMAGQVGFGGMGAYNASKFALEGLSQALAEEAEPFGVRVLIVEPGAFRTDFSGRSIRTAGGSVSAYANTQAGEIGTIMSKYHGSEQGDPIKAVRAIIATVKADSMPLRLPLGADAVSRIGDKLQRLKQDMDAWRAASLATAFDA